MRKKFQYKRLLEDKRFRQTLCYKLVIVMYIKPTTIYKTMKLTRHPNDRLFLVRLFIMLLLVLCTKDYIIYEYMEWLQKNQKIVLLVY
jgi:hypothetical protein